MELPGAKRLGDDRRPLGTLRCWRHSDIGPARGIVVTARRVPARRGVALDLKAGERNSTLSWRPTTNCVIGLPG